MAFIAIDGFEGYVDDTTGEYGTITKGDIWYGAPKTSSGNRFLDRNGRGQAVYLHSGDSTGVANLYLRPAFSSNVITAGMGWRCETSSATAENSAGVFLFGADGLGMDYDTYMCRVLTTPSGWNVEVRGDQVYNAGVGFDTNVWTYVELQATIAPTNHIILRINGIVVIDTDVVFPNSPTNFDKLGINGSRLAYSDEILLDDFYLVDEADFKGPLIVQPLPLTQGTDDDFTPDGTDSPATAVEAIDEQICNGDDSYVKSDLNGHSETFNVTFSDDPIAILLNLNGKTESYGANGFVLKDGTRETSVDAFLENEYDNYHEILETLDDGSPLTKVGADAQEYGFEVRTIDP